MGPRQEETKYPITTRVDIEKTPRQGSCILQKDHSLKVPSRTGPYHSYDHYEVYAQFSCTPIGPGGGI